MSPGSTRLRLLRSLGGVFSPGPRTVLRVTGADRLRFLNGQVTNDLRRLEPGRAMRALVLTAKGKLCADVWIWSDGDALLIEADAALEDSLPARLERYAVADDVVFEKVSPPDVFHVFGPAAERFSGLRLPRLGVDGVDLPAAPEGLPEASAEEVEVLRLERGLPVWGRELDADTLPQEAGLERLAVDFHKGCYVGQEVVSRIESVGRTNRRLWGFVGDFEPGAVAGAELWDAEEKKSGRLTSAAFHPALEKSMALGYLPVRATDTSFSIRSESGACLGRAERSEFPLVS